MVGSSAFHSLDGTRAGPARAFEVGGLGGHEPSIGDARYELHLPGHRRRPRAGRPRRGGLGSGRRSARAGKRRIL